MSDHAHLMSGINLAAKKFTAFMATFAVGSAHLLYVFADATGDLLSARPYVLAYYRGSGPRLAVVSTACLSGGFVEIDNGPDADFNDMMDKSFCGSAFVEFNSTDIRLCMIHLVRSSADVPGSCQADATKICVDSTAQNPMIEVYTPAMLLQKKKAGA